MQELDDDGAATSAASRLAREDLAAYVSAHEAESPRWVWDDTAGWYPGLLAEGVRVARCHDLRLAHVILRGSQRTAGSPIAGMPESAWDRPSTRVDAPASSSTLFDFDAGADAEGASLEGVVEELRLQLDAISAASGGLRLLLAAESVGALIACELRAAGLPWDVDEHARVLTELLGPRTTGRPRRLDELAREIRDALDGDNVNPDSQQDVLRALQRAGLLVTSTSKWELEDQDHAVIAPLLEYKRLSRLASANGWAWMDTWVADGRFRAEYIPGGVVTGRWATRGGGALQLPKQIRGAVRADPGWKLVVADAAQLEPRVLAGLARDTTMAAAGHGTDLYTGLVNSGVVDSRPDAKIAMLGAMYGSTTGTSGRLLPGLARAYPRAIGLVEAAARAGERGDQVSSLLGRSSPRPGPEWLATQAMANGPDATAADERRARSRARDWGRFTRNFTVQSTAAEWALCWMGELRARLSRFPAAHTASKAPEPFSSVPHLVFFLHDEVIIHVPAEQAEHAADAAREAATAAGRSLFGDFPLDFPLDVAIVDDYADAG